MHQSSFVASWDNPPFVHAVVKAELLQTNRQNLYGTRIKAT